MTNESVVLNTAFYNLHATFINYKNIEGFGNEFYNSHRLLQTLQLKIRSQLVLLKEIL